MDELKCGAVPTLPLVALASTSTNAGRALPEEYDLHHQNNPYQDIDRHKGSLTLTLPLAVHCVLGSRLGGGSVGFAFVIHALLTLSD